MPSTFRPAALALSLATLAPALTAQATEIDDDMRVVVTATRFPEGDPRIPAAISVVSPKEIEKSASRNVPDLLRAIPGVDVRPLYGSMGLDSVVDVRGTGEAAGSNVLVLIDGQRINPVDMAGIQWNTVPLDSIDRIEVLRGSSSVLYGDRASQGVINIISKSVRKNAASVNVDFGDDDFRSLAASASLKGEVGYGSIHAQDVRTDGYRRNSDARHQSFSVNAGLSTGAVEWTLRAASFNQDQGLPGSLSRSAFESNPTSTNTPRYRIGRDGYRIQPSVSARLSPTLRFEMDGSYFSDSMLSVNPDWGYRMQRDSASSSISPRLKIVHSLPGASTSETIVGLDHFQGDVVSLSSSRQTAQQETYGTYAQNFTTWTTAFDTSVGARWQRFSEGVADAGAGLADQHQENLTAWDVGAGYRPVDSVRLFGRSARNFRLPNTDELFAYNCSAFPCITTFNGTLKPQKGRLVELGASFQSTNLWLQSTLFRQSNTDEIGYIAANGRNANLDPTRRQGIEVETRWNISERLSLRASLTRLSARFTSGNYNGKLIPLVAPQKETVGARWEGGNAGTHSIAVVRAGARYLGGDFTNSGSKLSGVTTVDYSAEWKAGGTTWGVRVLNLTNKKYSASGFNGTYYPADPRAVHVFFRLSSM